MKKITYSVAFVATLLATSNTFAQQGFGTNTPHRSAAVEIKSSNKGLLIPRVALDSETQQLNASVDNANSLMVFNESGSLPKGYYYWNETTPANGSTPAVGTWVLFATGNSVSALDGQNAVTRNGNFFELGGDLNRNTKIDVKNFNFDINGLGTLQYNTNNGAGLQGYSVLLNADGANGTLKRATTRDIILDGLKGINGVTIGMQNVGTTQQLVAKLGGDIIEETIFNVTPNGSIKVQGLHHITGALPGAIAGNTDQQQSVTDLSGNLVAVGNASTGELKVATAKDIVDAGIVSVDNVYTPSTFNTTGVATQGTLVTKVNDDESTPINIGQIVRDEQTKTVVTSGSSVVSVTPSTDGATTTYQVAIDASNLVAEGVQAANGLTKNGNTIELGGSLNRETIIHTQGNNVKIQGLVHYNGTAANANNTASIIDLGGNVIPVGNADDGTLRVATAENIVKAGLVVDSGIKYSEVSGADSRKIVLGGDLHEVTSLGTDETNTLAITGLQASNIGESKNVIVDKDNKLRIIDRVYSFTDIKTANYTLEDTLNVYEEVNVVFKLSGTSATDVTFTLPASANFKGQTVNVSLANDTNDIQFLVIKSGNTVISEGSMPYQSWVFKSNGTGWDLVARK